MELQEVACSNWSGFGPNPKALVNDEGEKVVVLSTLQAPELFDSVAQRQRLIHFVRPLTFDELQSVVSHLLSTMTQTRKRVS